MIELIIIVLSTLLSVGIGFLLGILHGHKLFKKLQDAVDKEFNRRIIVAFSKCIDELPPLVQKDISQKFMYYMEKK